METKQLNLNAPLYSARRYSSPSRSSELVIKPKTLLPPSRQQSLPLHRSEYKNDVITKPASVPFHWEQTPGTPKNNENETPRLLNSIRFHSGEIPRPPPGRFSSGPPSRFTSGEISRLLPGRLSSGPPLRFTSGEIPRPPLGRLPSGPPSRLTSGERSNDQNLLYKPQVEGFSFSDHASLLERLNESLKCRDESGTESEDDAYSDALDDLSLSESKNYSVSGISGCPSSGMKPSGTFSVDAQTRDLMLNRFLPAAKAAVLETPPQYNVKKSPVVNEQSKQVLKKLFSGEVKKPVMKQYSSVAAMPYYNSHHTDNEESEDEYKESQIRVNKSRKRWGIIPRFCVKNSLCLLNPLPALKSKSRPQTPSFNEVKRFTRNALSGPLDKIGCPVPHKKKFHSGLLTRELPSIESKLSNSNQYPNNRDSYSLSTSPLRRYRSGNSSPFTRSPSRKEPEFLSVPNKVDNNFNDSKLASSRKLFKALQDVSRNQKKSAKTSSGPILSTNTVEKILHVDSVCYFSDKNEVLSEVKHVIKEEQKLELLKSPLPPPLPKSPSESWLWRTLPLGNPFSNSNRESPVRPKNHGSNVDDAKWETIVKSSNLHRDRARFSQELTPRASHRQKLFIAKEVL